MPTAVGPNTKGEENLVFAYDLGDVSNSYRGEPTINFIAELGDPTQEITRGEFGQYYNLVDIFETYGLVPYTLSMEIKGNIPGYCLVYMQNSSYTKYAFPLGSVNITTEWQRFSFRNRTPSGPTSAWQTNTPNDNRAMLATYTVYGSGRNPTVRNVQLELGAHETPFTAGTRSATQGLLDLTGNSTIDLSNVSFDSNAQMTFDGTDDIINLNTIAFDIGDWTFEAVSNSNTELRSIITGGKFQAGLGYFNLYTSGMLLENSTNTAALSIAHLDGNYHHLVGTVDRSARIIRFYVDGDLVATNTAWNGTTTTGLSVGIGANRRPNSTTNRFHNGDIPLAKIYNRALTASEIKSNFNAIKGRFNIL